MIKKLMFVTVVLFALNSCSTSQSSASSNGGGSTTVKASKETPNKTPGETPITQPVEKNSAKSILAHPAE